jgi:peptide alpha-N-acetyltransferase
MHDYENNELIQYEIMILTEAGHPEQALTRLEENSACITDRLKYFETRGNFLLMLKITSPPFHILASLLMMLGRMDEAERAFWKLVERNPDNVNYYKQIEKCHLGI